MRKISNYCSKCRKETNHIILSTEVDSYTSEDIKSETSYMIVKCQGCDNISFRTEYNDDTMPFIYPDGNYYTIVDIYPPKQCVEGLKTHLLPHIIRPIYSEVIKAINSNCLLLAAVGMRSVIEAICADKHVVESNLDDKINKLKEIGIITNENKHRLHSVRFMGNDAVHQLQQPNMNKIKMILQVINNILTDLYVIQPITEELPHYIKHYSDFENLINKCIQNKRNKQVYTLKNIIKSESSVSKDDLDSFEKQLIERINNREFTKLSLRPSEENKAQQYKIELD